MAGTLFSSSDLDAGGRQLLTSDNIQDIFYYSAVGESWDRQGAGGQSWFNELRVPNDSFDTSSVSSDKWSVVNTTAFSSSTLEQSGGLLLCGVEGDEGTVGLTSNGKWRLSGDFDIRLYIDWASYYNEYRSITHSFLKVGVDNSNAVRIAFSFDGLDGYQYSSEFTEARDLRFFDWVDNGTPVEAGSISTANQTLFFRITREGGLIKTYVSTGTVDTQIGDTVSGTIFSQDVFVELGVEAKEFNTYRQGFNKFFVFSGNITPSTIFFSPIRGNTQEFPETSILVVDDVSFSIIDETSSTLWMRLPFGTESPIPDNTTKIAACNGTIYFTTSAGIVALDFTQDKIFRYRDSEVQVADEPIALRNSEVTFRTFISSLGTFPSNSFNFLDCRVIGSDTYVAATYDDGVVTFRALASGIAYSEDGPSGGQKVRISEKGSLYWAAFDSVNNDGALSYFSNITALAGPGTNVFSRTAFYDTNTTLNIFGSNITTFDVRTVNSTDLLGVGTTVGLTFLSFSPGAPATASFTYGVEGTVDNPFIDPSFENVLGISWTPFFTGFLKKFHVRQDSSWSSGTSGVNSIKLRLDTENDGFYVKDTQLGVYQMVDLTGVSTVYFDSMIPAASFAGSGWDFEIVVGDTVVKAVPDTEAHERFNDSVDVSGFSGVQKFTFRIRMRSDSSPANLGDRSVNFDNLKTILGNPDFRVLPAGEASIVEVLLQFDSEGHKLYFSTLNGYGALDLDDNSLDYFVPVQTFVDGAQVNTAEFSRVETDD